MLAMRYFPGSFPSKYFIHEEALQANFLVCDAVGIEKTDHIGDWVFCNLLQ
jgi:hypothetical protein